jgi:hypothetical protein
VAYAGGRRRYGSILNNKCSSHFYILCLEHGFVHFDVFKKGKLPVATLHVTYISVVLMPRGGARGALIVKSYRVPFERQSLHENDHDISYGHFGVNDATPHPVKPPAQKWHQALASTYM